MKFTYQVNPSLAVEFESDTHVEAFKALAEVHELYSITSCGVCNGPVYPRVRENDGSQYHEIVCLDPKCRAKLALGANRKGGGLFPKRRDASGTWLDHSGFVRWTPEAQG